MSNKDKKPKNPREVPLPPMSPYEGLSDSDRQLLQLARDEAVRELAKRHKISEMVAGILLDAKLEELHAERTLKEQQLRVRELLDDCYPPDDEEIE